MNQFQNLIEQILIAKSNNQNRPFILGISGIDASGKGYISKLIQKELIRLGHSVHLENLDGWLQLPEIRFSKIEPASVFYQNGFRWNELKEELLEPYLKSQPLNFTMNYLEETWTHFEKKEISIQQVDFFILEGIFLFQELLFPMFSLTIWIDCSFQTAIKRAINRNQEGLKEEDIINAYNTIFFPAQDIHFQKDHPKEKASMIYENDV